MVPIQDAMLSMVPKVSSASGQRLYMRRQASPSRHCRPLRHLSAYRCPMGRTAHRCSGRRDRSVRHHAGTPSSTWMRPADRERQLLPLPYRDGITCGQGDAGINRNAFGTIRCRPDQAPHGTPRPSGADLGRAVDARHVTRMHDIFQGVLADPRWWPATPLRRPIAPDADEIRLISRCSPVRMPPSTPGSSPTVGRGRLHGPST